MRIDLIIALRDKMRSLELHQFDINDWANDCRTTCCAAGWATQMPEFQEAGLYLRVEGWPNPYWKHPNASQYDTHFFGFEAMQEVLDIDFTTSLVVFSPEAYEQETPVTPNKLANRLQFLLDHGEAAFIEHFYGVGYY